MRKLVITMPRSPYFIIISVGLTGLIFALFTEPTFMAGGGFSGFTHGRWGGVIVALLIVLWGCQRPGLSLGPLRLQQKRY